MPVAIRRESSADALLAANALTLSLVAVAPRLVPAPSFVPPAYPAEHFQILRFGETCPATP